MTGWFGYGFLRTVNGWAQGDSFEYIYPSAIATTIGFLLTLFMRRIYKKTKSQPVAVISTTAIIASLALGMIFSVVETYGHIRTYDPTLPIDSVVLLSNTLMDAYVLLGWSALYFGINYYLLLQTESQRALRASAMAHQAQLKMLRYQLNPHFLFNTLNAISTLVLDNQSENANSMLTKLSTFLRYSLVNQPNQKVSLAQELSALKLYLEIEEVRFGDRLKIDWKVEDEALSSVIPSLLLQPLIENSIKYAIAPSEDGGTLTVCATVVGGRLRLLVCDTGPGIKASEASGSMESSGVGLANTRERLWQVYDEDHEFKIRNLEPRGLEIELNIPFQTGETGPELS